MGNQSIQLHQEFFDSPYGRVVNSKDQLVAYFDLLAISEFYKTLPSSEDFATKMGSFLSTMAEYTDMVSIHILSDTGFIIPKEKHIKEGKYNEALFIVQTCQVFYRLIQKRIPFKSIITKGHYLSLIPLELNKNRNYQLNILPGGQVLAKCADADKKDLSKYPTGIYTDLSDVSSFSLSPVSDKWFLVDIYKYIHSSFLEGGQTTDFQEAYQQIIKNSQAVVPETNKDVIKIIEKSFFT